MIPFRPFYSVVSLKQSKHSVIYHQSYANKHKSSKKSFAEYIVYVSRISVLSQLNISPPPQPCHRLFIHKSCLFIWNRGVVHRSLVCKPIYKPYTLFDIVDILYGDCYARKIHFFPYICWYSNRYDELSTVQYISLLQVPQRM